MLDAGLPRALPWRVRGPTSPAMMMLLRHLVGLYSRLSWGLRSLGLGVEGLGIQFPLRKQILPHIMENQMGKTIQNEMETEEYLGMIGGL